MRPAAVLERAIQQLFPRAQPGELALPDGPQHSGGATTTALYIGAEALAGSGQEAAPETAPGQVDQNREAIAAHRQVAIERARYGGALGLVAAVQPRGTLPAPTYLSLNGPRTRYNAVREPIVPPGESADEQPAESINPEPDAISEALICPAAKSENVVSAPATEVALPQLHIPAAPDSYRAPAAAEWLPNLNFAGFSPLDRLAILTEVLRATGENQRHRTLAAWRQGAPADKSENIFMRDGRPWELAAAVAKARMPAPAATENPLYSLSFQALQAARLADAAPGGPLDGTPAAERIRWRHARTPNSLTVQRSQRPDLPKPDMPSSVFGNSTIDWLQARLASPAWQQQATNGVAIAGLHDPAQEVTGPEYAESAAAPNNAALIAGPPTTPAEPADIPSAPEELARQFFMTPPEAGSADLVATLDWHGEPPDDPPVHAQLTETLAPAQRELPAIPPTGMAAEGSPHVWEVVERSGTNVKRLSRDWVPQHRVPLLEPGASGVPPIPSTTPQPAPAWISSHRPAAPVRSSKRPTAPSILKPPVLSPEWPQASRAASSTAPQSSAPGPRSRPAASASQVTSTRRPPEQARHQTPPQRRGALWMRVANWLIG